MLRYHHHTAGDIRARWPYCRMLLMDQVPGGEAMCTRLESSWIFRMRDAPEKRRRGWWLTHVDGDGADVPAHLLHSHDRAASRWGQLKGNKLKAQGGNVLLGLLGKKKTDEMHAVEAKRKVQQNKLEFMAKLGK